MLNLTVLKDGKIKKTYLFSEDTTFKVSIKKDGMLRKGTLLALFTVAGEVYSVSDIQDGGVYDLPEACIGNDFYVRIVNEYAGGVSTTENTLIKTITSGISSDDKDTIKEAVTDWLNDNPDAVSSLTEEQQNKLDTILLDGDGKSVLFNNGTYSDFEESVKSVVEGMELGNGGSAGGEVSSEDITNAVSAYMEENPVNAEVADKSVTASKLDGDLFMTEYEYVEGEVISGDVVASDVSSIDGYKYREILLNIPVDDLTTPYNVEVSWDNIETNGTQGNTNTSYGYKVVTLMAYLSANESTGSTALAGLTKHTMLSFVNQDYSNASATQEITTASKFLKIGIRIAIWEDDTEYTVKNLNINVGGKTLADVSSYGMFVDSEATVTITLSGADHSSPLILRKTDIDFINNMSRFYGKKCLWIGDSLSASSSFQKTVDFVAEKMGIDITNVAVAGTGYALDGFGTAWYKRVDETYDTKYDIVVIFGGGNDAMNDTIVLGEYGDTTIDGTDEEGTATRNFYAVLDSMYSQIKEKYLLKDVLIINPLPIASVDNDVMEGYADAIVEMANKYKMPVLDLFHECYYNVDNETFVSEYTVNADGIHPTEAYHESKIAPKVIAKLKSI